MTYITLEQAKHHLNVDSEFTADDDYIEGLIEAAQEVVSKYIDYPLPQLEDENRELPKSLIHAMLLWLGTQYSIRESVSASSITAVPQSFELLCDLWRSYSPKKDE